MVSLVIVSHSQQLAAGVVELAGQLTQGKVAIAAAGGVDDPENPIGTDATQIKAAIESVYSDAGVVVLMDLGSAILSAELALEFLTPAQQANVYLCAAPLVEGAMAAAVQAATGSPATAVMEEALAALRPKQSQLGTATSGQLPTATDQASTSGGQRATGDLSIHNKLGLHARPAARFVSMAASFAADISVQKGRQSANAKSMNQVATLGVRQGETIVVTAVGPDAEAALAALQTLVAANFGEEDEAVVMAPETAVALADKAALAGIPASPGIAIGPIFHYRPVAPVVSEYAITDVAAEYRRLDTAVAAAVGEITRLQTTAGQQVGPAEADIFQAHRLILQDPDLQQDTRQRITRQHVNVEAAWQQAIEAVAARYEQIADAYMRTRAADVRDVGARVLRQLAGVVRPSLNLPEPGILLAIDLAPSDTVQLDPAQILGIITMRGGATSHSAILARGLGIPAVVGLGKALSAAALETVAAEGQVVAFDGRTGQVWLAPDAHTLAQLQTQRAAWQSAQQTARRKSQAAAITQDGRRLEIGANISGPKQTAVALDYGAEGVGLFRTEFLFMDRQAAPTEEEQFTAYRAAIEAMGTRPFIIRTLDVGGDKPLPYLGMAWEENPFLGWRGIRFCLDNPHIFKPQLRAILRATPGYDVRLMFPMVGALAEVRAAKAMLAEVQNELRQAGVAFDEQMKVGIMIEVPSAVAVADQLAQEVDFFSIGTNDLAQYVMAADRGNARVAPLADALHPAVLRLIKQTVDAAHAAGIWVGICGELAGDPLATSLLVGLGLDELSMAAPAIPAVKTAVHGLTVGRAEETARAALVLDSGTAVAEFLRRQGVDVV